VHPSGISIEIGDNGRNDLYFCISGQVVYRFLVYPEIVAFTAILPSSATHNEDILNI
jgi:hypothetical protein